MILFTIVFSEMECVTFVFVCNYQLIKDLLYGLVPFQFFHVFGVYITHYFKKKKKRRILTLT